MNMLSFLKQVGKVLHKEMKGGMAGNDDNFAALTAYVLIALMEAGLKPQVVSIIIQLRYFLCYFLLRFCRLAEYFFILKM